MAKEWAKSFYNSKAWQDCRESYIQTVDGLCERCLSRKEYTPGYELHHKVWLTPQNISDPNITLNWELLEFLCSSCHSIEHNRTEKSALREGLMFDEEGQLIQVGSGTER